jgi:phenylpropionate dioxygenase-like ring-hydroxylating dioxygenase large terminal subunit
MNDFPTFPVCIDADPALSDTLPGWVYTSPDALEAEREKIFYRSWLYAGATAALVNAGDYITAGILGQSVLVMRGRDGGLRGFYNVCQHRAHELLSGQGNTRVVTCPYHAWSYHDDGGLRTARGAERQPGFTAERFCLKPVRVEVFAEKFVFFNLDPDATPLASLAGDLAADMMAEIPSFDDLVPTAPRQSQPQAANWKVVLDNFHECYHCGPAHPAFADIIDMASYRTTTNGLWTKQAGKVGKAANKAYPVREGDVQTARFWFLWPTTTFGFMPGAPGLSVTSTQPLGPATSVRQYHSFALPGAVPDPVRAAYNLDVLGPEDIGICESVQRGLTSRGYTAGRFVHDPEGGQTTEAAVHHFHRLYAQAMDF